MNQYFFAPGQDPLVTERFTRYGSNHVDDKHVFSCVDIRAYVTLPGEKSYELGSLAMMSLSTHRDKFPVTSLGRIRIKGYTAGVRTIGGTLVFATYDRNVWHRMMIAGKDFLSEAQTDQAI